MRCRAARSSPPAREGIFDGFRFDDEGRLWTSAGDGVHCYDPDGTLLGKVLVPEGVANVVFGGPKRNRLFICATTLAVLGDAGRQRRAAPVARRRADRAAGPRVRRQRLRRLVRRSRGCARCRREVERALATILRGEVALTVAGRTDRGVHAWGQVASYEGEPGRARALNAVLPARRRRAGLRARRPTASTRAATRARAPTATGCSRAARSRRSSAGARCGGRGRSTSRRCSACAAALRRHARLHRLHPDADRPRALRARRAWTRAGSAPATSSSSGSRPTRSCAT